MFTLYCAKLSLHAQHRRPDTVHTRELSPLTRSLTAHVTVTWHSLDGRRPRSSVMRPGARVVIDSEPNLGSAPLDLEISHSIDKDIPRGIVGPWDLDFELWYLTI